MKKQRIFALSITLSITSLWSQEPQVARVTLQKIFSNLGPSTSPYSDEGALVSGPNNTGFTFSEGVALPFTPKTDAHVKQVRAGLQYYGGANQLNVSLYSDDDGTPGTLLAGPVTVPDLPAVGSCCTLAVATFHSSVAVSSGVQYWVVANTPSSGTGSDFYGTWAYVPPPSARYATDFNSGGWYLQTPQTEEPAGAVYGTIP
jgi:hypothetical protein